VLKICGGQWKGQFIKAPLGSDTRPTSAFLRESIFNTLLNGFGHQPLKVLDLFAGTGALGLEALSYGAESAIFIESSAKALKVIGQNIQKIASKSKTKILSEKEILRWVGILQMDPTYLPFDLAFCDPPYRKNFIPKVLKVLDLGNLWAEDALFVAEMSPDEAVPTHDKWQNLKEKIHGDSKVVIFKRLK